MRLVKPLMLLASVLLVACGDEKGSSEQQEATTVKKSDCVITYGWESRKPYQFFENKKMRGIDVDILAMAASQAGCDLAYVEKSWSELLEDVEAGKVDVLAGATPTSERKKFADFSTPYRKESFVLFVPTNSSFNGDDLGQFLSFGNKIGVSDGYFYGDLVDGFMNHAQYSRSFVGSPTNEASFYNVEYGRVDGVLVDPVEGRYIIKRKGLGAKMKESSVVIPVDSVAYMFSKKSSKADKIATIMSGLEQMVANNQIEKHMSNYQ
ncbi:MAG: amino acid ABC transporter substrate-binding protein [Gammaproteobacteria bacterium]|nr:amino acid ABC transporter substrate-binding protein [Gammaproteobacteria bacterium]